MKIFTPVLATFGVILSLLFGAGAASAGSEIYIKNLETRLGVIPVGQPTQFFVEIKNSGDTPVVFRRVMARSPEVTITQFPQLLLPGETRDVSGFVQPRVPGRRRKGVEIIASTLQGRHIFEIIYDAK